jgi:diacylglycerol kinase family enzyme
VTLLFAFTEVRAWRLIVAAAAVVMTILGMWWVLSRRAVARLTGAIVAFAGMVVLVAVVLTGQYRGLPIVVVGGLMVLAGGSARYALFHDRETLRAAPIAGQPFSRPARPVLLMNLESGGGKAERFRLVDECRNRGIEPVILRPGDDLLDLARDAVDRGADVIGMAGGDGSQALVATVASERGVPYVCVPAGTRNHFALDLGLDRDDVVGALDGFSDGVERKVDLARVNGRVFVNNATMGLYAKIVQSDEYRDAKLRTTTDMLPDMLGPDAEPFDLRFDGPDGRTYPTAHLILVSNNPYQLYHRGGRGTRARMDTGGLGIVAARIADAKDALAFAVDLQSGRLRSFRGWLEWSAPRFVVDSAGPVEIGVDGEALRMDPPLLFESVPGALRVRVPHHAPGIAPAEASTRFTRSTVSELAAVARGHRPAG